jgi:hypothetical protein
MLLFPGSNQFGERTNGIPDQPRTSRLVRTIAGFLQQPEGCGSTTIQKGNAMASHSPRSVSPLVTGVRRQLARAAQVNWTVLLWAIGVPIPIVLIVGLLRGCS